ncbi:MAG: Mur ligase family protein, partial [Planctomycetota bacterium]|nr:Mur ligase family protein [Planctomycetota bacterium]
MTSDGARETESFAGRRALVLGLGRFDGGLGTVRFLCGEGADVLVSDTAPRESLEASAAAAEALGARLVFGPQTEPLLDGCDIVLVNPAIPFEHPVLAAAEARGIPVTTEINIVLARSRAPVFGVTGTKGKSTTSTLLAAMLRAAGHTVHLGGNIGASLVGSLDAIQPDDRVVLELSSFQLFWAHRARRSPQVALVTNLLSDHLDRHGSEAHYAWSKRAILDYQHAGDLAVLPDADDAVRRAGWLEAGTATKAAWGVTG